jgi:uncharacterized protein (DUF488 family)
MFQAVTSLSVFVDSNLETLLQKTIYTIGHGNKSLEDFVYLLKSYRIEILVDIRSLPRSRRNPHFNGDNLEGHLPKADICYKWLKGLGGFRKSGLGAQSPHPALRSDGFRNYADYMLTQGFKENVSELLQLVHKGTACLMCAETLPFRCHRWYLSDYLSQGHAYC